MNIASRKQEEYYYKGKKLLIKYYRIGVEQGGSRYPFLRMQDISLCKTSANCSELFVELKALEKHE